MSHLARYVALAACIALTPAVAEAGPGRRAGRHGKKHPKKAKPHVEVRVDEREDADDVEVVEPDAEATRRLDRSARKHARTKRVREEAERDERVALDDRDMIEMEGDTAVTAELDEVDEVDVPVKVRTHGAKRARDWHVAIGPYLWASSVDANVSIGSAEVGAGVDFFDIKRHAKYGAEVLAEGRYGRFALTGDFMYGVVGVSGEKEVGPLMVTLDGTASSLLVDGNLGYTLVGDDHAMLSLEPRIGVRYQRTAISGAVGVAGSEVVDQSTADSGIDALAGARAFVRPCRRFSVSGSFDTNVVGQSNTTWSASADANVRITSHVQLSLGYRTLTIDRANVAITMHGPRAALQFLF